MKKTAVCSALALSMATASAAAESTNATSAPTIRTMTQAQAPTELHAGSTAVLVIDFQNEYYTGRMPIPNGKEALKKAKQVVGFAHQNKMPVYFVRHVGAADGPLFAEGSVNAEFHQDLQPLDTDFVINKATPSSFVGTNLDQQLKEKGIKTLIITGLMTHMCVSTTARDAVPMGYEVIIAEDATATRDLANWDGSVVDHITLQRAAIAGVADVFADIKTTQAIVDMPVIR
ncbi:MULTISPECIES: cysteine hydrolase family protein [Vibrio]|nr:MULTISPECIES: cysteine hydrolase family protein [Vibrio]NAW60295.1 isochorismatase family protein [Vibrio sp. V36_P2S2PM302]NAX22449.1 isochorismatase family protein [Vibrio sp. V39_P1S14PM300]NAX24522.1 isochorismatase family protein [Vibrio sp. V38_P2S17PM301]NAX32377.1 isochorismatase family protein [Vibrio sp. V37_P2S8PM304]